MLTITVSQLNRYIKAVIEEDKKLGDVYIKGEITGFSRHLKSGHCYFKLADNGSTVRAVMFRQCAGLLEFEPEDGMAVLARASVGVYERDGAYQLYVTELMPDGAGALAVALSQRKARLEAMGVFDSARKKPLPAFPARIGVATSCSGAALRDIQTVIQRRWPLCSLVLCSALVQGEKAPASLKSALITLDGAGCDIIILARGGGSAEELWVFNDEELVTAVFRCATPVVSAVGHETDYTLCDFAADARAPTPSAAAELAVPDGQDISRQITRSRARLRVCARQLIQSKKAALNRAEIHPALRSPVNSLIKSQKKVDIYRKALYNSKRIFIQTLENRISARASLLDSLSPLRVLSRGYCLARKGEAAASASALSAGDMLELCFSDGAATAQVLDVQCAREIKATERK